MRGRSDYAERVEARRERLAGAAAKVSAESAALHAKASAISAMIPFGQPILVGHHSERRARRDAERILNGHLKAARLATEAKALASAAAAVGTGGVSSDDPDAVAKLTAERDALVAKRDRMKAANSAWRKAKTPEAREALILETGQKESTRAVLRSMGKDDALFLSFQVTNLSANIRRIEKRIAELSKPLPTMATIDGGWYRIEARADLNRVALTVERRMSDASYLALRAAGWRWSPSESAFLWGLNNRGIYQAGRAHALLSAEAAS